MEALVEIQRSTVSKRNLKHSVTFFKITIEKSTLLGFDIQNVEQVQLVSDPILPASETFNQTFKNVNYCKQLKFCMRPWIRTLFFDDFFNKQLAFLKNVLATFWRSDKFKSFYTCVLAYELNRSTKGRQNPFQKHDLLHI